MRVDLSIWNRETENVMKTIIVVAALTSAMAAGEIHAQSGAEVLKAKGCLNCHDMQTRKMGPAYKDVAAKYKDKKGAEDELVAKLKAGTAHPKIPASDAELKAAVQYVLSIK
jgi:cytochrome c